MITIPAPRAARARAESGTRVRKLPEGDLDVIRDGETHGSIQVAINGHGSGIGQVTLIFSRLEIDAQPGGAGR